MRSSLPDEARAIIARHQIQDRERALLSRARVLRLSELRNEISAANARRSFLKNFRFFEGSNPKNMTGPEREQKAQADAELAELDSKIKVATRERERLEAGKPVETLTGARIEAELDRFILDDIAPVKRPTPTLAKGERDLLEALPRLRRDVDALKAERRRVENAPLTADAAKKIAHQQIDRLAARGTPRVLGLFTGGDLVLPSLQMPAGPRFVGQNIDGAALLAFLAHDALLQAVDRLIDFNAGNFDSPLTAKDREKQLAALNEAVDTAERVEAAAVEELVAQGHDVAHRPDISVLAVLSCVVK